MPSVYASIFAALPVISVFGKDWQETTGGPSAELAMRDVQVVFDDGVCRVTSQGTPIRFVRLRWNCTPAEAPLAETLFLGDAWERSYGDLQWRCHDASRTMPWYFLAHDPRGTFGAGVEVQPGAFAHWTADRTGVTLWLDMRCGTRGVAFGGRTMQACRVVHGEWESGVPPFTATKALCRLMCAKPLLAPHPVYGANNWYYAYGKSSHQEILADAEALVELCGEVENPPYAVIDDGWQRDRTADGEYIGGPWNVGNERFPDLGRLATEISASGARPGIWFRPLLNHSPEIPECCRLAHAPQFLDPSVPETLAQVASDMRCFSEWGYRLVKHDFSSADAFGRWGFQAQWWLADGEEWSFADSSRTSAEIITELYRTIHESAPEIIILGCNAIGHLGAGVMHLNRTGDDTSGRRWERTRKMGVNTLAFRLPQHRAFFDVDADCVGVTPNIPWTLNRQWAEAVAFSGTSLFVSIQPGALTLEQKCAMRGVLQMASTANHTLEPLDWLVNITPEHWRDDTGAEHHFRWYDAPAGDTPDFA